MAFIPDSLRHRRTVLGWSGWSIMVESVLATWTAFSAFLEVIRWTACRMLWEESFDGRPPYDLERLEWCLEQSLEILETLQPIIVAIWWALWLELYQRATLDLWFEACLRSKTPNNKTFSKQWELYRKPCDSNSGFLLSQGWDNNSECLCHDTV